MDEEKQAVYDEVCRVIGRAVVILKETDQPVTLNSINLMLQAHSDQNDDAYLSKIYNVAKDQRPKTKDQRPKTKDQRPKTAIA